MTVQEIIDKLIGPIEPLGDCSIDVERARNIQEYGILAMLMVENLAKVANMPCNGEASIKQVKDTAGYYLNEIKEILS